MKKKTLFLSFRIFKLVIIITSLFITFTSCKKHEVVTNEEQSLADKNATKSLIALHEKLKSFTKKGFAVGHQDATSYGIGWKYNDSIGQIKSDVKEVSGDFPAVYGFDIGRIEHGQSHNLDSVSFKNMKKLIIDAHSKGGIITISWHVDNPTSNGDSWEKTPASKDIINQGIHKEKYNQWLGKVAEFLKSLSYNGEAIPILFRPYHEMNGSWFWWGDPNSNAEDYKQLWKETVHTLRDVYQIHNLLYVYSPNKLNPEDDYMKYYPGDDYVDILGVDIYDFKNADEYIKSVVSDLAIVKKIATEKNKLYAFTETGLEAIPTPNWYSEVLYPNIADSGISWILFWRNHSTKHHYMPYKGHSSESDFKTFKNMPKTLFLEDIKN